MTKEFGQMALFDTPADIFHAAEKVRDAGFKKWDVFTPFPIHGMDDAMGLKRSRVPLFTLIGGIIGFFTGMFIAWYMGEYDYNLIVGGKPYFSPIFTFPVAYEMTILLAAFGTFFGMFITNMLPQHYHSAMNYKNWPQITDDKFALMIESKDSKYDKEKVKELLREIGGKEIEEIEE